MAAPTFLDLDDDPGTQGASVTSLSFGWDEITGEADNDVVLAFLYRETTAAYTATPANWQQVTGFPVDQDTGGFKYRADLWWRRRAGDTADATWSWTGSAWGYLKGAVYRGAITSETPVLQAVADVETAQNNEPVHPGLTIQRSNSGLIWGVWNFAGTSNATTPTGFTIRPAALQNDAELFVYDDLSTVTGATGTITGDLTNPEFPLSVAVELATEAAAGVAFTPRLALLGVG